MKILYAAGTRKHACVQMERIIKHLSPTFEIKIAAFLGPLISFANWNLNALRNFLDPDTIPFKGENYEIYADQVKSFAPDLILSDLESYTSVIGIDLGIPVWQINPVLTYYGLSISDKIKLKIKNYNKIFTQISGSLPEEENRILSHIIKKSERKLAYSHFGDLGFKLISGYDWIRPFHVLGKESKMCQHEAVSICPYEDKNLIKICNKFKDPVIFGFNKDINNQIEYACNLKNAERFYTNGISDYCADAYYNGKYNFIVSNLGQDESSLNMIMSTKTKIGIPIDTEIKETKTVIPNFNQNIKDLKGELL